MKEHEPRGLRPMAATESRNGIFEKDIVQHQQVDVQPELIDGSSPEFGMMLHAIAEHVDADPGETDPDVEVKFF